MAPNVRPKTSLLRRRFLSGFVALVLGVAVMLPSPGTALSIPSGPVLLTITGNIAQKNTADSAAFDREMLEALGMQTLRTTNPFEIGVQKFDGVLLRDVLDAVGAEGERIIASALDGYTVEIPILDAANYRVLLAMRWNDEVMTVRNKGPIWVIYPIDQHPELAEEEFSVRTIWQLQKLLIE